MEKAGGGCRGRFFMMMGVGKRGGGGGKLFHSGGCDFGIAKRCKKAFVSTNMERKKFAGYDIDIHHTGSLMSLLFCAVHHTQVPNANA